MIFVIFGPCSPPGGEAKQNKKVKTGYGRIQSAQIKNDAGRLSRLAHRFMELCANYQKHFIVHGRDVGEHARHYLTGLLGRNTRKSIGRIEEELPGSNYQGLQQFISDSPWDDRALMRQVRAEAEALLGRHRHTALYLDETSFAKKGTASVGVQRQYCGRLGKLENCQVGVFACLGRGERAALVDFRLFPCRRVGCKRPNDARKSKCRRASVGTEPKPSWPWRWCARRGPRG